ncbi:unnamed protein product [Laminaria digitata]
MAGARRPPGVIPAIVPAGRSLNKRSWCCGRDQQTEGAAAICDVKTCKRWLCHRPECVEMTKNQPTFRCCYCVKDAGVGGSTECSCHTCKISRTRARKRGPSG